MAQFLSTAAGVSTALGFLGLVAALIFLGYALRLKRQQKRQETLPPDERAALEQDLAVQFGLRVEDSTPDQRYELVRDELRRRFQFRLALAILFAVVFITCFAIAVFGPPSGAGGAGTQPTKSEDPRAADTWPSKVDSPPAKKRPVLRVSLARADLDGSAGVPVGGRRETGTKDELTGDTHDEIAKKAAGWVRGELDRKYPASTPSLEVVVKVVPGPPGAEPAVELTPDQTRTDRLWIFGRDGGKTHVTSQDITRRIATAARAAREAKAAGGEPADILHLHCERPGYRLVHLEVPLLGGEVRKQMARLDGPQFTVVVARVGGDRTGGMATDLTRHLQAIQLRAGGEDLRTNLSRTYQRSLDPGLKADERMDLLEAARVDAILQTTLSEE